MNVYKSPEVICCVHGCDSKLSFKTFEHIKLHPFPQSTVNIDGKSLLFKWIEAVKLTRKYNKRMRVCSLHFSNEDFVISDGKKELKKLAVPSKNLPRVWRNKLFPRDYGRMIKQLEYRGIGRLRLCHEAKLVKRVLRSEAKRKKKWKAKSNYNKRKEKKQENPDQEVCVPKVSTTFSLSADITEPALLDNVEDKVDTENHNFTSEIMIKEEPLSETEEMEGDETHEEEKDMLNFEGRMVNREDGDKEKEDTVEEMLAKMNAEDGNTRSPYADEHRPKKSVNSFSFDFEDTGDSAGSEKFCNICGDECTGHEMEFECIPCGKVFKTNRQLNAHNLSHSEYRTKKLSVEEQRLKDEQAKETTCKVCHKVLSTKMTLTEHMLIHSGEKPHVCMLCDKAFRHKANLVQHVNTHTLVRNYKCKMCRQYFYTLEDLDKHVKKHRVMKKEYSCRECGQTFRTKTACWAHLNSHTRGRSKAGLACHICGRVLSTKATLKEHMFIHSGEKPFECLLCGKKIRHRANFIIHVQGHSLGQPHVCSSCGLSFAKKGELNSHIAVEHPEDRPFGCIICGMRFRTETRFHKHAVTHDATLEDEV